MKKPGTIIGIIGLVIALFVPSFLGSLKIWNDSVEIAWQEAQKQKPAEQLTVYTNSYGYFLATGCASCVTIIGLWITLLIIGRAGAKITPDRVAVFTKIHALTIIHDALLSLLADLENDAGPSFAESSKSHAETASDIIKTGRMFFDVASSVAGANRSDSEDLLTKCDSILRRIKDQVDIPLSKSFDTDHSAAHIEILKAKEAVDQIRRDI